MTKSPVSLRFFSRQQALFQHPAGAPNNAIIFNMAHSPIHPLTGVYIIAVEIRFCQTANRKGQPDTAIEAATKVKNQIS
jgi:hypothetical protein